MESLEFEFSSIESVIARKAAVIVGVLGSGNLEVLVEPRDEPGCRIRVETSAQGFGEIWQAVLADVIARWNVSGVAISINDAGATPAVVALRLDQALTTYTRGYP